MSDATDNLMDDVDLLSILESSDSDNNETEENEVDKILSNSEDVSEDEEADKKIQELRELVNQVSNSVVGSNPGSGDIDQDLSDWFDGYKALPSDELNGFVSNSNMKMEYGLARNSLSNYKIMSKLRKFIEDDAFDLVFSSQAIIGLDPEDILDRTKTAFVMYKNLASLNERTLNNIKNLRLRSNSDSADDIDRLTMLLSSISSDKLTAVLKDISMG